jgi:nicotinamidase-related amidase
MTHGTPKTALVVIDVQQALVDELQADRRSSFLATLTALLARARNAGVPVVYVRHNDEELAKGSAQWELAREIAPRAGEPIVEKTFRDAFRETNFDDVLQGLSANHLIVCGMQTEYCIDATIREAERRGYRVTLVGDGTATYPAGGLTEEQIRDHVHRVAYGTVAGIEPASALFT